jgi:hypothetical protein|tara:strand:- start:8096 stop:8350 length:255 start_codon:yes stop_codon:yes gene_type:complete
MAEEVKNEAVENDSPQLSLQDIATMVQVIDICSKRGGFEGPELEVVGGLRSRIVKFLEAAAPKDQQPEGQVPTADAEPVEDSAQ